MEFLALNVKRVIVKNKFNIVKFKLYLLCIFLFRLLRQFAYINPTLHCFEITQTQTHTVMAKSNGEAKLTESVEEWYKNFGSARQKVTKLHFYFQDVNGGSDPTVLKVVEPTANSATSFGQVSMVDDLVTEGPEPDSKKVGRAQGTIGFADLNDTALQMVLNIEFTEGEYAGSTISILGRNQIFQEYRELPIVGGTGVFRLARGSVVTNTYSFDTDTKKGVLEYTLFVVHYEACA